MKTEQVKKLFEDYRKRKREHFFMMLSLQARRGNRSPDLPTAQRAGDVAAAAAAVLPLPSGQGPLRAAVPLTGFPLPQGNGKNGRKAMAERHTETKAYTDHMRSVSGCDTSDGHNTSEQAPFQRANPVREQKPARLEMTSNTVRGAQAW